MKDPFSSFVAASLIATAKALDFRLGLLLPPPVLQG